MNDISIIGYMSASELQAHFGGASRSWIEAQVKTGVIPSPIKIAGRLLWQRSAVAAYDSKFVVQALNAEALS